MIPPTPAGAQYTHFACPNPECSLFNRPGHGNLTHRSWTGKHKDIERLRCRVCGQEFSERAGTLLAASKLSEATVERLLKCQRWGVCDAGTADICDVDIKTVHRFQRVAAERAKRHHRQVVQEVRVEGVQMDEVHSKRRPRQVDWIYTALAMGSLFILWVEIGARSVPTAARLIAHVVARLCHLPVLLSDGWKGYTLALLQVVGRRSRPRRKGKVGRKPKPRLVAPPELCYGQIVKVRKAVGRVISATSRVVFGGPRRFFKQLTLRALGHTIQTAFMERFYATLRSWVAALRRRSRCLSWSPSRHQNRIWLIVSLYNWVIPHKSLRLHGRPRSPAMAIGLTDHLWSYHEYIWLPVYEDRQAETQMAQRIEQLLKPALPNQDGKPPPAKARPKQAKATAKPIQKKAA